MRASATRIVVTVSVWHVAASTCYYGLYVATPYLREGWGASHTEVGLVLGLLSFGYALSLLPVGAAIDARGERMALVGGLVGPPAFGLLVDLSGYRADWWLLAGCGLVAALLLVLALTLASPVGAHGAGGSR